MELTPELRDLQVQIEEYAKAYGLDFPKIIYEVLDWKQMNEVAAYGGFPNRYPHWRFGMEYESMSKQYAYGLSKIFEMVINTDPCYAYLLYCNYFVDQKMVMAHVCGHADFFKNNLYFAHTNRKMMDEMANHKSRVQRYMDRYGVEAVENFIDACLSIDTLIDYHASAIKRQPSPRFGDDEVQTVHKIPGKSYMDRYLNPKEFVEEQEKKIREAQDAAHRFPEQAERDVMGFLMNYAPLENWERDVLSMLREEAYYFAPQGQTKIMNEGWASFWHSTIMTEKAMDDSEVIDYAERHSGTMAMSQGRINPYKIGIELFRDIKERWDKGRFGPEYEACTNIAEKKNWDKKLGKGMEKIFEVRKLYCDVTFIDEFLTPEFCKQHKLFVYGYNVSADQYQIVDREFEKIKQQFLFQLTNFGHPTISVVDANYKNRAELLLKHDFEGVGLRGDYAKETLKNLFHIWRRPVNIETVVDGTPKVLSFDGSEYKDFRP